MFGSSDGALNTVTEGRWAYFRIATNLTASHAMTTSPYGYLRAPWNVNKSPYLTRIPDVCGVKKWGSWPSCQTHYDVTFSGYYDMWYNYVWGASYTPHGPVHTLIGGYSNCQSQLDDLGLQLGIDNSTIADLKYAVVTYLKGAWRAGLLDSPTCSVDTPQGDCHMQCASDPTKDEDFVLKAADYIDTQVTSKWVKDLEASARTKVVETVLCKVPYISGDQLEAGSPSDPSFWPIHPTVDRLLQYRRMVNDFLFPQWSNPTGDTSFCLTGNGCTGHHEDDIAPFQTRYVLPSGDFVVGKLTNAEIFNISNPSAYRLAYIYEHFTWAHCDAQGWEFIPPMTYY